MKTKKHMILAWVAASKAAMTAFAAILFCSVTGCVALSPDRPDGFVPLAEAVRMARAGEIRDGKTVAGLLLADHIVNGD